jgi:hypothetical protein
MKNLNAACFSAIRRSKTERGLAAIIAAQEN